MHQFSTDLQRAVGGHFSGEPKYGGCEREHYEVCTVRSCCGIIAITGECYGEGVVLHTVDSAEWGWRSSSGLAGEEQGDGMETGEDSEDQRSRNRAWRRRNKEGPWNPWRPTMQDKAMSRSELAIKARPLF